MTISTQSSVRTEETFNRAVKATVCAFELDRRGYRNASHAPGADRATAAVGYNCPPSDKTYLATSAIMDVLNGRIDQTINETNLHLSAYGVHQFGAMFAEVLFTSFAEDLLSGNYTADDLLNADWDAVRAIVSLQVGRPIKHTPSSVIHSAIGILSVMIRNAV